MLGQRRASRLRTLTWQRLYAKIRARSCPETGFSQTTGLAVQATIPANRKLVLTPCHAPRREEDPHARPLRRQL